MCTPTPTSTIYSTSTSFITYLITTSTPILSTPPAITSTISTSSCLSTLSARFLPSEGVNEETNTSFASEGGIASGTSSSNWGGDHSSFNKDSSWASSASGASDASLWTPSWTSGSSEPIESYSSSAGDLGVIALAAGMTDSSSTSSLLPVQTRKVGQALRKFHIPSTVSSASFGGPTTPPQLGKRQDPECTHHTNSMGMVERNDNNEDLGAACASWTAWTTFKVITQKPSTSWSQTIVKSTTSTVTSVPISTLFASCTSGKGDQGFPSESSTASESAAISSSSSASKSASNSVSVSASASVSASDSAAWSSDWSTTESAWSTTWASVETSYTSEWSENGKAWSETTSSATSEWSDSNSTWTWMAAVQTSLTTNPASSSAPASSTITSSATSGDLNPIHANADPTSSSGQATSNQDNSDSSSSNKGVSAGAAVGGVVGLLLALGGALMSVRFWLKRKRGKRLRIMRSSWFYGGDVAEPDDDENALRSEKHASAMQSRFSAPSLASGASRISRAVPSFLALPISSMRHSSGRFPNVFNEIRKSMVLPKTPTPPTPPWAQQYSDHPSPLVTPETTLPPVPPLPVRTAREALDGDSKGIRTRSPPPFPTTAVPFSAIDSTWNGGGGGGVAGSRFGPPKLELGSLGRPRLEWGHSYASPPILSAALPSTAAPYTSRSSDQSTSNTNGQLPLESLYSQGRTLHSMYTTDSEGHEGIVGQALTAPGRVSPGHFEIGFPDRPKFNSITFPQPMIRPPSNARNLVPAPHPAPSDLPLPTAPFLGNLGTTGSEGDHNSSLFEFADWAGGVGDGRYSGITTRSQATNATNGTVRQTRNWYEKPLWDGSQHPQSTYSTGAPSAPAGGAVSSGKGKEVDRGNHNNNDHDEYNQNRTSLTSRASRASAMSGMSKASESSGVWTVAGEEMERNSILPARKSRSKSVRWGDEEPLPKVFDLARAL